jgi:hypothetical protein
MRGAIVLAAAILGFAAPAAGKNLCGRFDTDQRFFLLEKVKTKLGAHGPVTGYLTDGTDSWPIYGTYGVYTTLVMTVSANEAFGRLGFGAQLIVHNWTAPLASGTQGTRASLIADGAAGTLNDFPADTVTWVDCKTVPKFAAFLE